MGTQSFCMVERVADDGRLYGCRCRSHLYHYQGHFDALPLVAQADELGDRNSSSNHCLRGFQPASTVDRYND